MEDFRIFFLSDQASSWIPPLARLFVAEWEPYYGENGPGDATADLRTCCNRMTLPVALVAVDGRGHAVGTAALKSESTGSKPGQTPWLAAFVVDPRYRRRGIGDRLIGSVEILTRSLGFEALHVSTDAASGLFVRRGWSRVGSASSLRGPLGIYRLPLSPESSDDVHLEA